LNKPRLAIEVDIQNDDTTRELGYTRWELGYTTYFDISETEEILKFIQQKRNHSKIKRFYFANEYGTEMEW